MSRSWELSPLEFIALWAGRGEWLPEPFHHRTEPGVTAVAARRERAVAAAELRERWGGLFDDVLDAVTRPDIRVVVHGVAPADGTGVFALATRTADQGYLIVQQPSGCAERAGGFTVTEQDVLELGDAVAAALPECPAGSRPGFTVTDPAADADLDHGYHRSTVRDVIDTRPSKDADFGTAAADLAGTITVQQGVSRFGPRGINTVYLHWRDLTDDGRYVVVPGNPATVIPAGRSRLTSLVNAQIAEIVRAIKDDRA
ncbi:ESX secretion-associated protein EspG [Nocardia harenae]|uniref:ESX secretion-associated protein EspG n=1 Tax=Nocardia harenae TaxID=358707 RepID=UPI00082A150A|nr:ESX secretion-associated protein EspG [Nocardia harenae]